ncbi:helix-turn-helix transcriptional regulator [Rhodanobacter umsongensis]|uniref:Helix-turn-helix transcriptional regulator n=1 Tax=Rhodanobacter umsongensis TaxID=633153 RepID=A0ABW0JM15_9GAMM
MTDVANPDRIITYPELKPDFGIKYSRVHLGRLEKVGQFPQRVPVSSHHIGWLASELRAWMASRAAARVGGGA